MRQGGNVQLFDLLSDPGETQPLADPEVFADMRARVDAWFDHVEEAP